MMQTIMFDLKGKPTELGMRYVKPRYYTVTVKTAKYCHTWAPDDVHVAIGLWLKHPDAKIVTHW
jgi:hypothetical protein